MSSQKGAMSVERNGEGNGSLNAGRSAPNPPPSNWRAPRWSTNREVKLPPPKRIGNGDGISPGAEGRIVMLVPVIGRSPNGTGVALYGRVRTRMGTASAP